MERGIVIVGEVGMGELDAVVIDADMDAQARELAQTRWMLPNCSRCHCSGARGSSGKKEDGIWSLPWRGQSGG